MFRFFPNAKLSLNSLLNLTTDLVADGLLFCGLLFYSRTALSAEVLFLRKQLAFYEERQVQPRRLNDSARLSLILWSRLCNWKEALVIVKPETLISWHRNVPSSSPPRTRIPRLRPLLSGNDVCMKVKRMVYLLDRSDFELGRDFCAAHGWIRHIRLGS